MVAIQGHVSCYAAIVVIGASWFWKWSPVIVGSSFAVELTVASASVSVFSITAYNILLGLN